MKPPLIARHAILIVLVTAAPAAACRQPRGSSGVSDSTFVATMAELKQVNDTPGEDSAQRAARRETVLQGRGLSPAQLERKARELARNPAHAQEVWKAVERRAADTARVR